VSRTIAFVAPTASYDVMRFLRAVARLEGVRLLGIFQRPSAEAASRCRAIATVDDALDVEDLTEAVRLLQKRHGRVDRLLGINEVLQEQLAEVRSRFGIPGTPPRTARLFRDKAAMKDALRAAGLPVAKHALLHSKAEGQRFAREVGLPLVLKPPAGVGAKSTFRVHTEAELGSTLEAMRPSAQAPVLAEELLQGTEHSFETITVAGKVRANSFADYHPGCLEVLETPWVQWACVLPRAPVGPHYTLAEKAGLAAIRALGLDDGMTHMEWFARSDGSIAIGEIAQRPPGPQLCQMVGLVNDVDIYRAWARAVVDRAFDGGWSRRFAAGCAYVRGVGQGRIVSVTGVHETWQVLARHLVEARLPVVGRPKNPSYEGDGVVVVRHEQTRAVLQLLGVAMKTLRIGYDGT
jgi:biotin carboxylase